MKKRNFIIYLQIILSIILIAVYFLNRPGSVNTDLAPESSSEATPVVAEPEDFYEEKITALQEKHQNPDIKATIEIPGTDFFQSVLQSSDNDFYLTHSIDKISTWAGSVYLDYRNNIDEDSTLLIFGHSSTSVEAPFNYLENYYNADYRDTHKIIELKTTKAVRKYELFSIFVETSDFSYMNLKPTGKSRLAHLDRLKSKSWTESDIELSEDTNILIVQTCSNLPEYQNYAKKYLILVFREI